jgi:hypothetical protein
VSETHPFDLKAHDVEPSTRQWPMSIGWLARLALLPEWTTDLMTRAGLLEGEQGTLKELIDRRLCDSRAILGKDGVSRVYWVRSDVRTEIGLQAKQDLGRDRLLQLLADLRERLSSPSHPERVDARSVWEEAVDLVLRDPTGQGIVSETRARNEFEASELVETAAVLADVLGGTLALAVERGRALVSAKYRQTLDERALAQYVRRGRLEAELEAVLANDESPWAIHLLGVAGVGKTMTLRYLASGRFAAERGLPPLVVATIDFDHLDPRYPVERPLLLLEVLASQLVSTIASVRYVGVGEEFSAAANRVAEEAGETVVDLHNPLVVAGIQAFARLAASAPGRVVLILDTTEELAKAYGSTGTSPAVEQTFSILRSVQDALATFGQPPLKVVFAGRRWLIGRPDGRGSSRPGPQIVHLKEFDLRVVPVDGFTRPEAKKYLRGRLSSFEQNTIDAILARAASRDRLGSKVLPSHESGNQVRFNPFELATWASWTIEQPRVALDAMSAAGDPYVERRIIGRITEPTVRQMLAIVVSLGRFDRLMIEPACRRAGLAPSSVMEAFASQEWIQVVERTSDGLPAALEVDEHLLDRLRAVIDAQPGDFPLDRYRLGMDVSESIASRPLRDSKTEAFTAAIQLLPHEEARAFWSRFEGMLVLEAAWDWVPGVLERVEAAAVDAAPELVPAIRATRAAVLEQRGGHDPALWRSVERSAPSTTDAASAILVARARLATVADGEVPSVRDVEIAPVGSVAGALWAAVRGVRLTWDPPASSTRASRDGIAPDLNDQWISAAISRLLGLGDLAARAVGALACVLTGRAPPKVAQQAGWALSRSLSIGARERDAQWVDWPVPPGLVARCYLVWLATQPAPFPNAGSPVSAEAERLAFAALGTLEDIDSEKLASLALRRLLDASPLSEFELERFDVAERRAYRSARRDSWPLHTELPRLVEVIAAGWSTLGRPDRAESLLRNRIEQAIQAANDPGTVAAAQLALLRLLREYRVPETAWSLGRTTAIDAAELHDARALLQEARASEEPVPTGWASLDQGQPEGELSRSSSRVAVRLRRLELQAIETNASAADLFELARYGRAEGDLVHADMAVVLGVLAVARAGKRAPADQVSGWPPTSRFFGQLSEDDHFQVGWKVRLRAAEEFSRGGLPAYNAYMAGETSGLEPPYRVGEEQRPPLGIHSGAKVRSFLPSVASVSLLALVAALAALSAGTPLWVAVAISLPLAVAFIQTLTVAARRGAGGSLRLSSLRLRIRPEEARRARVTASTRPVFDGLDTRWRWLARFIGRLQSPGVRIPKHYESSIELGRDALHRFDTSGWRLSSASLLKSLLVVDLDVDAGLDPFPWEHWVAASLSRPKVSVLWLRTMPGWPEAGGVGPGPPHFAGPINLANNRVLVADLANAETSTAARLIHVIGTPVTTSGGWRIRVAENANTQERPQSQSQLREGLVAPTQVAAPGVGVVVLQAAPIDAPVEPLGTLREAWFLLAREMLSAGASSVVIVPPMDDLSAAKAVEITTTWCLESPSRLQPAHVLGLLAQIRTLVRDVARGVEDSVLPALALGLSPDVDPLNDVVGMVKRLVRGVKVGAAEAAFPGDVLSFEVLPDPDCSEEGVSWSGGGNPSTGTGPRFTTSFPAGGAHTVTATCGASLNNFSVTICPLDQWLVRAAEFYGPAIDFKRVRVKGSGLVNGPAGTGWTCNDVIRFKRPHRARDLPDESTLIHELGHVWEHQSGQAQLLKGLVEQVSRVLGRDPYDFGGPTGVHAGAKLTDFKKEGQAEIIRDYWMSKHGFPSDMRGVAFSTPGYVDDLRRLVEGAGIGSKAPHGHSVVGVIDGVVAKIVNSVIRLVGG